MFVSFIPYVHHSSLLTIIVILLEAFLLFVPCPIHQALYSLL
jgi:hypothetical protein